MATEIKRIPVATPFVSEFGQFTIDHVAHTYMTDGVVLVALQPPPGPETVNTNLFDLQPLFGTLMGQKHGKDNIVHLTMTEGVNPSDGVRRPQSDNGHQRPHTDGAFGTPPEVLVLACFQKAETGGESVVVDMKGGYEHLMQTSPELVLALSCPEALTVIRGDQTKTNPVFQLTDKRVRVVYSDHEYNATVSHPEATQAVKALAEYVTNQENQTIMTLEPGEILILNNSRLLHGRKSFIDSTGDTKRWLMRGWYNGQSPLHKGGFVV